MTDCAHQDRLTVTHNGLHVGTIEIGRYKDRGISQYVATNMRGQIIGAWGDLAFAEHMLIRDVAEEVP